MKNVRNSVIAGSWYPGDESDLSRMVDGFLENAPYLKLEGIKALVVPHAGYIYSGQVAAFSYKQIKGRNYKKVIILAPSHHYSLIGASIGDFTHYLTPLGEVPLSGEADKLRDESPIINNVPGAHLQEHSLEIQLPFLQRSLQKFEIIPIVLGRLSPPNRKELADQLIEYLDEKTLVIASTDLSHFHPYQAAVTMDKECISSITSLDIARAEHCEMCGYEPVLVLMEIAKKKGWNAKLLKYANSGDVIGDKSAVVGYSAIAFYTRDEAKEHSEQLNKEQQTHLLKLARDTLELYVKDGKTLEPETDDPILKEVKGTFVTLEKNGQLRGCIGHIHPVQELRLDVRDNAISAAAHDPRFNPVKPEELEEIEIEVSVLTNPEVVKVEDIQEGMDGVILDYQGKTATYLPQVWEQIPKKEDFLSSLCQKAFLPEDCWKNLETKFYRYRVQAFKEEK